MCECEVEREREKKRNYLCLCLCLCQCQCLVSVCFYFCVYVYVCVCVCNWEQLYSCELDFTYKSWLADSWLMQNRFLLTYMGNIWICTYAFVDVDMRTYIHVCMYLCTQTYAHPQTQECIHTYYKKISTKREIEFLITHKQVFILTMTGVCIQCVLIFIF